MNNSFDFIKNLQPKVNEEYKYSSLSSGKLYNCETDEKFNSFIFEIKKDNFKILQERTIENNRFVMAQNGENLYTFFFSASDKTMYATKEENGKVPLLSSLSYGGDCEPAFYAFENDHCIIDCGMCLLMQCRDYSFFVVDSGHYFQFNDNDRIYRFMRERTPKGRKVVINGWFITHGHTDHVSKLIDFLKYNMDDVVVEGFYHNLLAPDYPNNRWEDEEKNIAGKCISEINKSGVPVYALHTGERVYIRDFFFDVLYTHEDMFPEFIEDYNDSSVAIMLSYENTKIFIPGDAAVEASKILERRFPKELKADIVQVAHHGHTGLSVDAYEKINAKVAIFCITKIMFDNEYDRKDANRKAIELADSYFITSDGTVRISLPYDKNGITVLPDETFEDFGKIFRIWKYEYSDEYKKQLYDRFVANGGSLDNIVIPALPEGYIEPK